MPPPSLPLARPRTQHLTGLNPPLFLSSRSSTTSPTRSSVAQSLTQTQTNDSTDPTRPIATATLRLRGAHDPAESRRERRRGPAIRWAEDVIDNEGMGRKNSKVCCIYHRPRVVGESGSEANSSSSSDDTSSEGGGDSSGVDDGVAKLASGSGKGGGKKRRRAHHRHRHTYERNHGKDGDGDDAAKGRGRRPSPNAYERMPKTTTGSKGST